MSQSVESPKPAVTTAQPRRHAPPIDGTPPAFMVTFAIAGILMLLLVLQFWVPMFLGGALAVSLYPFYRQLTRFFRGRKNIAALVCTLGVFLILVAPAASIVGYSAGEVTQGLSWVQNALHVESFREMSLDKVPTVVADLMGPGLKAVHLDAEDLQDFASQALGYVQHYTPKIFSLSLAALGNLVLMLLSFFVFLCDGPSLQTLLLRVTPLRRMHTRELLQEFHAVASASLFGMGLTATLQSGVIMLGFFATGIPHVFFFGILTLIAAFVPLIGSALVWLPASLVLGFKSSWSVGVGLALWSIVAVNIVDNVIKPMVLKGRMAMPMPLAFLGLLGGLGLFGPVGVIAGPLVVAFFTALLRIYERDYLLASAPVVRDVA